MSLNQLAQDEHFLQRNNRAIKWLAKQLAATIKTVGYDQDTGTEMLDLEYNGWKIEIDYLNMDRDDDEYWWTGSNAGGHRVGSRCRNLVHLKNSIKKRCVIAAKEVTI